MPRQMLVLNLAAHVVFAAGGCVAGRPSLAAVLATLAGFFAPVVAVRFYRRRR